MFNSFPQQFVFTCNVFNMFNAIIVIFIQSASLALAKQVETRTKDGKRRITPILLSAPGDLVG
jgi:hypothetical protein